LVISNGNSFRVLFDKTTSGYFIRKIYFIFWHRKWSMVIPGKREPAPCQLHRSFPVGAADTRRSEWPRHYCRPSARLSIFPPRKHSHFRQTASRPRPHNPSNQPAPDGQLKRRLRIDFLRFKTTTVWATHGKCTNRNADPSSLSSQSVIRLAYNRHRLILKCALRLTDGNNYTQSIRYEQSIVPYVHNK